MAQAAILGRLSTLTLDPIIHTGLWTWVAYDLDKIQINSTVSEG